MRSSMHQQQVPPADPPAVPLATFRLAEWWVHPARGLLRSGARRRHLKPQAMEVLTYLASRRGQVVSKEELLGAVWKDRAVEENAIARCVSEIRRALGDDARQPSYIETIARRGYRVVPSVVDPHAPNPLRPAFKRTLVALATMTAALLLTLAVRQSGGRAFGSDAPSFDQRVPVAVLQLTALHGEDPRRWLGTALTEMLVTELALSPRLSAIPGEVVAKLQSDLSLQDSRSFADETLQRLRIAVGARFVVSGSYLRMPAAGEDTIRLDLKIRDTATGEVVTAVVESGDEADLAELVFETGRRLRQALGDRSGTLAAATPGSPRDRHLPAVPEAARLYFQGLDALRRFETHRGRDLLLRSIDADPDSAQSHLALAAAWSDLGHRNRAIEAAGVAVDLSTGLPRELQLWAEARFHAETGDWVEAIAKLRALWIFAPHNLEYGLLLAETQNRAHQPQSAVATIAELRRRSGRLADPRIELAASEAAELLGDFEGALAAARTARTLALDIGAHRAAGRALYLEAVVLYPLTRVKEAFAALEAAREQLAAAGDRRREAETRSTRAAWLQHRGRFAEAAELARQALATYREIGDLGGESRVLRQLADFTWSRDSAAEGEAMYHRSLAILRETGDRRGEAEALGALAISAFRYGPDRPVRGLFEQALAIYRAIGDQDGIAKTLSDLGKLALHRGHRADSIRRLEEAREVAEAHGLRVRLADVQFNLGYALSLSGAPRKAIEAFGAATELHRQMNNVRLLSASLEGLGTTRIEAGQLELAREHLEEALALRLRLGDPTRIASSQAALADALLEGGDPASAETLARQALATAEASQARYDAARCLAVLARVLLRKGDADGAWSAVRRLDLAQQSGPLTDLNEAVQTVTVARVLAARGQRPAALARLEHVRRFADSEGWQQLGLYARLATAEIDLGAGRIDVARAELSAIRGEAHRSGFGLLAARAEATLGSQG